MNGSTHSGVDAPSNAMGADYEEKTIYHSPETPGYTAWCTLWRIADGRLRLAFQQVTGAVDQPQSRRNTTVILNSSDNGETWQVWREVAARENRTSLENGIYASPADSSFCGHGLVALPNGTLVTGLWGAGVAESGYVQYSRDGGDTWSVPIFLMDKGRYKTYPTVIRQLRDGRLILFAGVWDRELDEPWPRTLVKTMFVSDDEGRTWGPSIIVMSAEQGVCEESDFCELPNGELFWVHRVEHWPSTYVEIPPLAQRMSGMPKAYSDRMQSIMRREGAGWQVEPAVSAPFPHSGFPEELLTAEGVILHIATDAIWWTADCGSHWERLAIPGSSYYPRALQLPDGRILVIGHVGSDDSYGSVDQSIRQQSFRLKITP